MALNMPSTPFFWDASGAKMSPDEVKRKRRIADAMIEKGTDYSPIVSPWQGVARIANAISGKYQSDVADMAETNGRKQTSEDIAAMFGDGKQPDLGTVMQKQPENPWGGEMYAPIANALLERQMEDPSVRQARQLELEKAQLELEQMRNPKPGWRTLTDDEERQRGLDASKSYQEGPDGKLDAIGGGGVSISMGGGSDKQVFDAMMESATSARAAATGLNSIREARKAIEAGAILGAGADVRLGLQKVGALLGVADPNIIQNTETFRSAIAPQVAALMKATVGSTQISNADREFAEKAAGGSISLDPGTINRLLGIMEKAGTVAVNSHMERLNKVYPDAAASPRERALFEVQLPQGDLAAPQGERRTINGVTYEKDPNDGQWYEVQ